LQQLCQKAAAHCRAKGKSIEQLAIRYAVENRRIPTTLFSTTQSQSVLQNIRWIEEPLDEELLAEVRQILEPRFRDTWLNN
jgi:aryl-alcohol dehydrogenase-like predicted oxidoreductase